MFAEVSLGLSITRRGTEGHPILSSPLMPSQRVGGWAEPSGSSELVSPGRQRLPRELGAGQTARGSKRGARRPDRRRYLELHFLIHLQQRGHGRAGPCPLRWRPEALWAPGRGSEGREETRLLSDATALAGSLTARSLAPSLPPCCLPARLLPAACSLSRSPSRLSPLTPDVTSQPIAGTPARMRTALRSRTEVRLWTLQPGPYLPGSSAW